MVIAILADTHDNAANTVAALEMLAPHKPAAYLHCGDMVSVEMLRFFEGLPLQFVFGNNDYDHAGLRAEAKARGLTCLGKFGELEIGGKSIAIMHGDDEEPLLTADPKRPYDYVFVGHSHQRMDRRAEIQYLRQPPARARVINPGALHRAATKSVALLDVGSDALTYLTVQGQ